MKKYLKVGYVKFVSEKSKKEIEHDEMKIIATDRKKNPVNPESNMWLFSREDGTEYPIIVIYSTDRYFLDYDYMCECRKITEISKNRFKSENVKIPRGYHLYRANIYLPLHDEYQIDESYDFLKGDL